MNNLIEKFDEKFIAKELREFYGRELKKVFICGPPEM